MGEKVLGACTSGSAKITYFNEYVNATEQSALGVLRRTARPEDFVVFKLDIDTPHVEQQIMDILLSEEGKVYTDLIDEFYFEYQGGEGGPFLLDSPNTTVSYGVQMLQQLRRRGGTHGSDAMRLTAEA